MLDVIPGIGAKLTKEIFLLAEQMGYTVPKLKQFMYKGVDDGY